MPAATGDTLYTMIVLGILPFNLLKGTIIMVISLILYKSMKHWIVQQQSELLLK